MAQRDVADSNGIEQARVSARSECVFRFVKRDQRRRPVLLLQRHSSEQILPIRLGEAPIEVVRIVPLRVGQRILQLARNASPVSVDGRPESQEIPALRGVRFCAPQRFLGAIFGLGSVRQVEQLQQTPPQEMCIRSEQLDVLTPRHASEKPSISSSDDRARS